MEKENSSLKSKSEKLEKKIISEAPTDSECVSKKYETSFQKFLVRNIDRSKMASMIHQRNEKKGIGYDPPKNFMFKSKPKEMVIKPKALYSHFTYIHTHDIYFA